MSEFIEFISEFTNKIHIINLSKVKIQLKNIHLPNQVSQLKIN